MLKKRYPCCVPKNPMCCPNAPHTGVQWDTFSDSLNCKYLQMYSRLKSLKCRYDTEVQTGILVLQIANSYHFLLPFFHGRPRKNNHPFGIYENIKLGLINYTLLGLIEHHGVFIDSGHYVSYIRQSNKWYHCDDKHITETNLLTLSNNVYLTFYAKEVDLGT